MKRSIIVVLLSFLLFVGAAGLAIAGPSYTTTMSFFQGSHLVRTSSSGLIEQRIADVPETYLESVFHDAGFDRCILDFDTALKDPMGGFLLEPIDMLSNGFQGYLTVAPAEQWDALLFVDTVTPATPL